MNEDKKYCVYIHTNKINNKKYVGQTCQVPPERRWQNGQGYCNSTHFYNAIKKYGWDNFEHKIIAQNLTTSEANELESKLIAKHKTMNQEYGYNLTSGGDTPVFSEASIQRMSDAHKGYRLTEEQKRKLSIVKKGKKLSDETKRKISEAHIGFKFSDEAKSKMSKSHIGNKSALGHKLSDESKQQMINKLKGRKLSDETRKRMSGSRKKGADALNAKKVAQYTKNLDLIKVWDCMSYASNELKISMGHISSCCHEKRKSAGGYVWKFVE